ncbi:TrkA family potassium uptake protein [candidate division KSB1 bacterium]|nr:MAG: TrkA family potassium uptake protein [candidate division KSB1 bacterium]MBC6949967.1 TrkA family potassium uptake protein [candidate division KSB1 bacterium]MCE7944875.1 TrkA family potassium uptake protein [Chlorobi bacterium CHB1]MDL1877113.1 TrkA family potassium uptake protein [Cytophagia bacterium CHB2]
MRSFAVIGLSSFGYHLCKNLSELGAPVMAIDVDAEKIDDIKPFVQKAVVADAKDKDTLKSLGMEDIDVVVVTVGEPIEVSILITLYLREIGVKEIIAKVITEDHAKILDKLGVSSVVFPERDMAKRIAYTLRRSILLDYVSLGEGYSIVEMGAPSDWLGKPLAALDVRRQYNIQIIVIKDVLSDKVVIIPGGDYVLKDSDILVMVGRDEDLEQVEKL